MTTQRKWMIGSFAGLAAMIALVGSAPEREVENQNRVTFGLSNNGPVLAYQPATKSPVRDFAQSRLAMNGSRPELLELIEAPSLASFESIEQAPPQVIDFVPIDTVERVIHVPSARSKTPASNSKRAVSASPKQTLAKAPAAVSIGRAASAKSNSKPAKIVVHGERLMLALNSAQIGDDAAMSASDAKRLKEWAVRFAKLHEKIAERISVAMVKAVSHGEESVAVNIDSSEGEAIEKSLHEAKCAALADLRKELLSAETDEYKKRLNGLIRALGELNLR